MYDVIDTLSVSLSKTINSVINHDVRDISLIRYLKSRLVKFLIAFKVLGADLMDWEMETIEVVLGRQGLPYKDIESVYYYVYLFKNMEDVLTDVDHFENAIQITNDSLVDVETTEKHAPEKILWTIVLLKALNNAENLPLQGRDIYEYIAQCFIDNGWTQPPLFLADVSKFDDVFPYYDEEYIQEAKQIAPTFDKLVDYANNANKKNAYGNYFHKHLPLIEYIKDKAHTLESEINLVIGR